MAYSGTPGNGTGAPFPPRSNNPFKPQNPYARLAANIEQKQSNLDSLEFESGNSGEAVDKFTQSFKEEEREGTSLDKPLDNKNKGFQLLLKMGWKTDSGLGSQGQGRQEPVAIKQADRGVGVGVREHEAELLKSAEKFSRKRLETEREETEELKQLRQETKEIRESRQREVSEMLNVYYCEPCGKQYRNVAQYEEHVAGLAHGHVVRLKELRRLKKGPAKSSNDDIAEALRRAGAISLPEELPAGDNEVSAAPPPPPPPTDDGTDAPSSSSGGFVTISEPEIETKPTEESSQRGGFATVSFSTPPPTPKTGLAFGFGALSKPASLSTTKVPSSKTSLFAINTDSNAPVPTAPPAKTPPSFRPSAVPNTSSLFSVEETVTVLPSATKADLPSLIKPQTPVARVRGGFVAGQVLQPPPGSEVKLPTAPKEEVIAPRLEKQRSRSPQHYLRDRSPRKRSRSPIRRRSRSPFRRRSRSPLGRRSALRSRSPFRRRSRSPPRIRERSPYRSGDRSPRRMRSPPRGEVRSRSIERDSVLDEFGRSMKRARIAELHAHEAGAQEAGAISALQVAKAAPPTPPEQQSPREDPAIDKEQRGAARGTTGLTSTRATHPLGYTPFGFGGSK